MTCEACGYDPAARVLETWTMRLESYCPTANTLKGNSKGNHVYRKWRGRWENAFGDWLQGIPPATKLRRVTITRLYGTGKRAFDRINFAAGCKPLLDVITNYGAIYDDSALWCLDFYKQTKSTDGKDYIEILIEELA